MASTLMPISIYYISIINLFWEFTINLIMISTPKTFIVFNFFIYLGRNKKSSTIHSFTFYFQEKNSVF